MMKVLTVLGARPQFVKAAVVSRAFREHRKDISELLVHTGQHYDPNMSDVFFEELEVPRPHVNLGVGGGTHAQNTGRMLEKLEDLMLRERPDRVLVYGDTDSTLAGALVAAKLHVPLAHVEAGLRSFNRRMPEEINRVLTDHVADLLFAPTTTAEGHLVREGIDPAKIHLVGDVMYDAALFYKERARQPAWFDQIEELRDGFCLCTMHRAENTDNRENLRGILEGLATSPYPMVLPLHPRTRKKMQEEGLAWPGKVHVVEPVGYLEMVWLEAHCRMVLTDSGGVQKEAFFHGKPCITLREETEWVELVQTGWNHLTGADARKISERIAAARAPLTSPELYGRGDASVRVVEAIR